MFIIRSSSRDRNSPPHHQQQGYGTVDNSHLSYEMRARLERPPDSNVSMGIFSNPYTKQIQPAAVLNGFRIVVSNLHSSVSQSDIKVWLFFLLENICNHFFCNGQ